MNPSKLAVYGILKRGFPLDLRYCGGVFVGEGTVSATLYHIGSGVGLRFDDPSKVAHVEVFDITGTERSSASDVWKWLDIIESNGQVYTRKTVNVAMADGTAVDCWIYEHTYWPQERYNRPIEGGVFTNVE